MVSTLESSSEDAKSGVSFALELYRSMCLIRLAEEKIAQLYSEEEMRCPVHLCIGQEAVAVGACASLEAKDKVLSNHRAHGHFLAKGGSLKSMLAEIYGKKDGCAGGRGGSMHLIDLEKGFLGANPIVGGTIPIAVGIALSAVLKGEELVSMVFLGDGAAETGIFHESMNFAAVHKLPVVFVCENNFFSVYSSLDVRQPANRSISELGSAHGLFSYCGDGNDVLEVYELCRNAVQRARKGDGPSLLEFKTYRWLEHCGPSYDNQLGYRNEEDLNSWKKKCPIKCMEKNILKKGLATASQLERIQSEEGNKIDAAVSWAKKSPYPNPDSMKDFIYA